MITALWHGQHFMVPLIKPKGQPFAVLMAAHADAEMNAIAIERLGLQTIRASGAQKPSEIRRKKGMVGFLQMLKALKNGTSIAMTADVPKGPAKKAGRGIVMLARHSGRPIMPLAYASSRRWNVNSWDSASFNLPFSRAAVVTSDLIYVPPETTDEEIDAYCARLTESLNEATRKAYAIVDRTE
ncbi:lysophospholipid acyltransferase family protein [Hartmannibacter diazotrophicus]|uniref:lysophospholipid acyltransferase family protein n=1 Tax=Hartmannibacter diazotrophicus TaxID=1482074 RepID=UPI0018D51CD1|nr:lysophospholipid acyltransferase family protein [Hartmannibacter diazotrophicus]